MVESIGESDSKWDNVKSTENLPTIPANTPDLAGHISKMGGGKHAVIENKLVELARPTVIFYRIDELKIPELDDAKTNPSGNLQNNGATPPVPI